jgi:hypothetical protein
MALLNFDGSPHGGSLKLLPEWNSQPHITPVLILDHTIVGSALGAYYMFRDVSSLESHFIIRGRQSGSQDGHIWQLMDTGREAHANYHANNKAVSIETEDNGAAPIEPWSRAQLESLTWLHNKLQRVHPSIKRLEARDCDGPGLGYHAKLGAPSCWTPSAGKTCPGPARISQWRSILLPAFLSGQVDEGGLSVADVNDILDALAAVQADVNELKRELLTKDPEGNVVDSASMMYRRVRYGSDLPAHGGYNLKDMTERLGRIEANQGTPETPTT